MRFIKSVFLLKLFTLLSVLFTSAITVAGTSVPNTFSPGSPAVAAQVNANFQALANAIDSNAGGNIKGQVLACGPVVRSLVYIPGHAGTVYTGSDGKFEFDNLVAGTYSIVAEVPGESTTTSNSLVVTNGATTTSNVDYITARVVSDVNNCGTCGHVCGVGYAYHCVNSTCQTDTYLLTTSVSTSYGSTGSITSSPAGINCGSTCNADFADGSTATLTATPGSHSVFAGWSGGVCSGPNPTCVITMDNDKSVTAMFGVYYALQITVTGAGVVTSGPSTCTSAGGLQCNGTFSGGSLLLVYTAVPNPGHTFTGWSGACTGLASTCGGFPVTSDMTVTATFSP